MPNIIGGKFKKTKLDVPNKLVRPTSAFKREAIFSILESYAIKHSIEIYKNKSINSLRKAGEYAITNELFLNSEKEVISSIESVRVEAKNKIRIFKI